MIESTFFYTGLIAFTTMVIGLGLTILEFRKLGQSHRAEINREKPVIPEKEIRY